ncbi:unnamed protein product [Linum trigynum]|uniref:Uncharacterized protein n=1 Tax=Linum trigynum TaxID=586398 RepID=A0AAV2FYL1_9ROSI
MELDLVQQKALVDPSPENFEAEGVVMRELNVLLSAEESFLRQKSRETWLKTGDTNSDYFHRSVRSKQKRSRIRVLKDEDGLKTQDVDQMAQIAVRFYGHLLGRPDPEVEPQTDDYYERLLKGL